MSNINLYCCDVFDFLNNNDKKFHICFTSPPYNFSKKNDFGWKNKSKEDLAKYIGGCIKDNIDDYVKFSVDVIKKLLDCCEYVFWNIQSLAGNKKDLIEIKYILRDYFCDEIIWHKKNGTPNGFNKRVMTNTIEYIWIFSKKPTRAVGTNYNNWKWYSNYIEIVGQQNNNRFAKIHKATFPLKLAYTIIKRFTNENDLVLDCFGGIGTTAIACKKLNRNCVLVDREKQYIDCANLWLKQIKGENNAKTN